MRRLVPRHGVWPQAIYVVSSQSVCVGVNLAFDALGTLHNFFEAPATMRLLGGSPLAHANLNLGERDQYSSQLIA